ncbi:MAG: hypothetical protein ACREMT_12335, partial [Vulcanimicrobiaceae bacterium]
MPRFNANTESRGFSWAYRDLLTALLVVFIAMATLALVAVVQKPNPTLPIQGNLIFTMHWDGNSNSDIDLWVKGPNDSPIGYRRMSGLNCNLLRDDLGQKHDPSSQNEEMAICRNAPPGAYAVNVVAYNVYDRRFPVHVSIESYFSDASSSNRLFERDAKLMHQGQEVTVARFELMKHGELK